MPNVYTSTDPGSLGTSLVQTALDRFVRYKLRATPMFRGIADTKPVDQSFPGTSVVFQFWNEIVTSSVELSETVDPDSVGTPSTSSVTVTLKEYGASILYTRKVQLVTITDVTEGMSDLIAWNMRDQIDGIVGGTLGVTPSPLMGGTHVIRVNGGAVKSDLIAAGAGTTGAVATTDLFTSKLPRLGTAKLRGNKVVPRQGELYGCMFHPDIAHDLLAETGSAAWRDPHNFSGAESIWTADVGIYEGMYFVTSPRLPTATDGSSSAKVYRSLFYGRECLAEAVAEEPNVKMGPVVDKLGRFTPLGWYGLLGWNRFREDALIRVETSSSVA